MRKHKSVVAILLAVMMIFTFMPTMAFAATHEAAAVMSWDDYYAGVTDVNKEHFDTERTFSSDGGLITAVPQDKTDGVEGGDSYSAPTSSAYFYDFDGSFFVFGSENKKLDGTTWTQDAFNSTILGQSFGVQLVEPNYTKAAQDAAKAGQTYKAQNANVRLTKESATKYTKTFGPWSLVVEVTEYDNAKSAEDQTITFSVKSFGPTSATQVIDGMSVANADKFGTIASATITVKGVAKTPDTAGFYLDTVGGTAYNQGVYDGNTHTVVADATPGWTVSYSVLNANGKFDPASAVTVSDVQETATTFRATFKDNEGKKADVVRTFNDLNLDRVDVNRAAKIGFNLKDSEKDNEAYYTVPGTTYDANDYLVCDAQEVGYNGETAEPVAQRAAREALNAGAKSAVAANAAQLKEYFNDYYEFKDTTTKAQANEGLVVISIVKKSITAAEDEALTKKYAALIRNIGTPVIGTNKLTIELNGEALVDDEIEFTSAVTSKTYSGKKTTKKGKLKKNQSFTVKAVSNAGLPVYYKLVNANTPKITINKTTGKITVKKNLTKGTYKFKVKAYTISKTGSNQNTAEYQSITVKIKK